jgi:hypothetical protein
MLSPIRKDGMIEGLLLASMEIEGDTRAMLWLAIRLRNHRKYNCLTQTRHQGS